MSNEPYISQKEAYAHMGYRGGTTSAISQMMKKLRAKGLKYYGITNKRRRYLKSDIDAFIAGVPAVEETVAQEPTVVNSTIKHIEAINEEDSNFN